MLPYVKQMGKSREVIQAFRGYYHREDTGIDRFYQMENMTQESYPAVETRRKRRYGPVLTKPNGLIGKSKLCWVDGTDFYYNGALRGQVEDTEKQLVSMGAFVVLLPDKKLFNTQTLEWTDM